MKQPLKLYLMTDLEGPAGVNRWVQTREGETPEKHAAMRLLTGEVNAAVEGILEVAPQAEVVVLDGHGSGGLIYDELHDQAQSIMHGTGLRHPFGLDGSFDGVLFIGQHAMAGTPDAPLCHTYSSQSIEYYHLNGVPVGEFGCFSVMAGSLGVPVLFLAGDDKACAEARALIPEIITVETKKGMGVELAQHLSVTRAREQIRRGAAEAVRKSAEIPPYRLQPPYELEIRVQEGRSIDGYLRRGLEQLDERTVLQRGQNLIAMFNA